MDKPPSLHLEKLELPMDQKAFYLQTLIELNGVLEDLIGESESGAFLNHVAQKIANLFLSLYQDGTEKRQFTPHQLAEVLVDLKRRVGGQFSIVDVSKSRILLCNTRCPFGDLVIGRPSMCQMTSTVFGKIVADSNGYAGVNIDKSIAAGDNHCVIEILLEPESVGTSSYREYFSDSH